MDMSYMDKYEEWLSNQVFDEDTKKELESVKGNDKEIEDRFYKDLEFGTGGLRGVIGAGSNRINRYTVRRATQGLANYIIENAGEEGKNKGVVIAFDSRNYSSEFALETALCLNANGIKAYLFESLRPTPELSFAVRELKCIAGVVITASHNPPEYNGYKVYWEDGAQITPPHDKGIIAKVNEIADYSDAKIMSEGAAKEAGLLEIIGEEIDNRYEEELLKLVEDKDVIKEQASSLKIVYTPLHGTGNIPVRRVLAALGFENVYVVSEQERPDGNFPTVSYPNPEDKNAFALALKLAKEKDADLVLATDPDADRLGVYVKDSKTGEYHSLTGNMSGILICQYLLEQKMRKGTLPQNGAIVSTIVTTDMAKELANKYNLKFIETLTGFKFIGEQIKLFEENNSYEYVFGFEESYGCLVGTHARDKDAVVAVMSLCEAAAYYRAHGKTLWDQMQNIFEMYGYYREGLASITLKGVEGAEKIQQIIQSLRNNPPQMIGDYKVLKVRDYKKEIIFDMNTKEEYATNLPVSNVLYYELSDKAWCCVRPSGTEPKIKFYMGVVGSNDKDSMKKLESLKEAVLKLQ